MPELIDKSKVLQKLCAACYNTGSFACISCVIPHIIKEMPSESKWIRCVDRLPEPETDVLVYYPRWYNDVLSESGIVVAKLMSDGLAWDICGEFNPGLKAITHWMPLPDRPDGGAKDGQQTDT